MREGCRGEAVLLEGAEGDRVQQGGFMQGFFRGETLWHVSEYFLYKFSVSPIANLWWHSLVSTTKIRVRWRNSEVLKNPDWLDQIDMAPTSAGSRYSGIVSCLSRISAIVVNDDVARQTVSACDEADSFSGGQMNVPA